MQEQTLKKNIAKNIAHYRKLYGMTQLELAERINYSDKSVSKWERGDGIPDVYVLTQLAELFDVALDDLICEGRPPKPKGKMKKRIIIPLMSVVIVWLVAAVVFMTLKLAVPDMEKLWLAYLYAVPVSCIVLIVFLKMWWNMWSLFVSVSALVWSIAVCVHLSIPVPNIVLIYIIAGIMQLLVVLWYIMKYNPKYSERWEKYRSEKHEKKKEKSE